MNPHLAFFWVPAALLLGAGALMLLPRAAGEPLERRNRRTAGILLLLAGVAFAAVASGATGRLA